MLSNLLSRLAFRAPRKPQPGLFIGQGHPWGEERIHSHSTGAKCNQGSQLAQATLGSKGWSSRATLSPCSLPLSNLVTWAKLSPSLGP